MPYSHELSKAIRARDLAAVQKIVQSASNPGLVVSNTGYLATAIDVEAPEIVSFLIKVGANVNGLIDGESRMLMAAAYVGNLEICKLLVEAGAKVNAVDSQGESAIFKAACGGHQEVFNYLAPLSRERLRAEAEMELEEGIRFKQVGEDVELRFVPERGENAPILNKYDRPRRRLG